MEWLDLSSTNCSMQRTLSLVGEKWTLLLIRDAANGVHRFDDFHGHIGLSEPVLADRLRKLVDTGIFETRTYQAAGQRTRSEYRLTRKGWDLFPVLVALTQFGDQHLADPEGPPWVIRHQACGYPVEAVVRCSHDHEVVTPRDASASPGPGAKARS